MSALANVTVLLLTLLVSACGGGGGSSLPQTLSVSVVPSLGGASVTWTPRRSDALYNVYVDGSLVLALVNNDHESVGGLAPSSRHCVEVHSRPMAADASEDGRSNEACFFTLPSRASGLALSTKGRDTIALRWTVEPPDAAIREFRIVRDNAVTISADASARSYDDTGLAPLSEHCYGIRSANDRGDLSPDFGDDVCLTTAWRDSVVGTVSAGERTTGAALSLDPAGEPVVAYIVAPSSAPASGEVWLARLAAASWTKQRIAGGAARVSIAVDAAGTVHLAFTDASASKLRYATSSGGFTTTTIDDVDASMPISLAVDDAGNASIAYNAPEVRFATNRAGSWSSTAVAAGQVGPDALAVDAAGSPYVAFNASDGAKLATRSGGGWSIDTVVPFLGFQSTTTAAVDVANDGTLHVASDLTTMPSAQLIHLERAGTAPWERDLLPMTPVHFFRTGHPSIVVTTDGRAHVAASGNVVGDVSATRYWTNASGAWLGYTIANGGGGVSLDVDASGERHAVYATSTEIHYVTTRP
jgi:hypothetical protein